MTPDSKTETPQRVGPLAPGSVIYALFEHMDAEHGLTLLGSELTEIISIVNVSLEARLEWWIANAEGIAQERGELFRAGEAMRAVMVGHAWDGEEVGAWDASAQPMRDMIAAHSQNNRNLPRRHPLAGDAGSVAVEKAREIPRKTRLTN